jgi:hypothetical protein
VTARRPLSLGEDETNAHKAHEAQATAAGLRRTAAPDNANADDAAAADDNDDDDGNEEEDTDGDEVNAEPILFSLVRCSCGTTCGTTCETTGPSRPSPAAQAQFDALTMRLNLDEATHDDAWLLLEELVGHRPTCGPCVVGVETGAGLP